MSELLKKAISAVTQLPDGVQDEIAQMMLAMSSDEAIAPIAPEHAQAVAEGMTQSRAGKLASDADVNAAWRRFER